MEGKYKYWFNGVKYIANNKEEADAHCEQLRREQQLPAGVSSKDGFVTISEKDLADLVEQSAERLLKKYMAKDKANKKSVTKKEGK